MSFLLNPPGIHFDFMPASADCQEYSAKFSCAKRVASKLNGRKNHCRVLISLLLLFYLPYNNLNGDRNLFDFRETVHPIKIMKLPGQSEPASEKFDEAVESIQERLGRKIVFLPLEGRRSSLLRSNVGGYHDSSWGTERVWLDASLPFNAAEATAAHELGHIMQKAEGYPRVSSTVPALEHLASRINDLVMDESADMWAIKHGFDMSKAFGKIGLKNLINHICRQAPAAEPADWDRYFAYMGKLVPDMKTGESEGLGTQIMVLDYAGLSLRLGRYGLFEQLDAAWAKQWPISRKMGKELLGTLGGMNTRDECREALQKIIAFLKIPPPLINLART
jgi:hypothetical protein